jgi:methionine sulfoxide reductase heme-binding subunit
LANSMQAWTWPNTFKKMDAIQLINVQLRRLPAWPLYILGVVPGAVYFYWAFTNQLGADPVRILERQLGLWSLQLLIVSLLISTVRNLTKINLIKFRRAIGLLVFFYAVFHVLVYLWLDQQWLWDAIYRDLVKRPYIMFGMTSFVALIPLALTANDWSIRNLGCSLWIKWHRLAYLAIAAGAIHYLYVVKTWQQKPVVYSLIVLALLGYRLARFIKREFLTRSTGVVRNVT